MNGIDKVGMGDPIVEGNDVESEKMSVRRHLLCREAMDNRVGIFDVAGSCAYVWQAYEFENVRNRLSEMDMVAGEATQSW